MQARNHLSKGQLYLLPREVTFDLTVELALKGGVRLLVCGNRLPFYDIAYELARRVGQHYERILKEQIFFSRAETCIQLVDFLCELDVDQADPTPLIVSDFLTRFSDEDQSQVDNLFFQCQVELQRLSQSSLVFISAKPRPPYERLWHALNRITQPAASLFNTENDIQFTAKARRSQRIFKGEAQDSAAV